MLDTRKTLIYCRESRDDNGENYGRIETQRKILVDFCKKNELTNIVDIVMDDDTSGTSFKRFTGIIERVRNKEIEVIVFKDASRLGRNLRESLEFVETLENYGVEIIFESEDYDEDFFPLKAWFNEQRAKEDSKKIRRVLQHKMEKGTLLVKPTYGYMRGENNELLINPETSKVIKKIYDLTLKGYGTKQIAGMLNKEGIPTPSQSNQTERYCDCWNSQHVYRILINEVYTGKMIYGKKTNKSYKNKKIITRDKADWIVIENHHEAIIPLKTFEKAQSLRETNSHLKSTEINRPFSGLLECGRCGSNLLLRTRKGRRDFYICAKNHREGAIKDDIRSNYGCRTHSIIEGNLYLIVEDYLRKLISNNVTDTQISNICRQKSSFNSLKSEISELETKIAQTKRYISKIYDDNLSGKIDDELFIAKYKENNDLVKQYEVQLEKLKEKKAPSKSSLSNLQLEKILAEINNRTITNMMLRKVFDKIVVFYPNEITQNIAQKYKLTEENYKYIYDNGGLVFVENASANIGIAKESIEFVSP